MADVNITITRDFSYQTRRLKVGETLTVKEAIAKVLVGIKKAEYTRKIGVVPPPPPSVIKAAEETTPQPAKKPRRRRAAKKE